MNIFLKTEIKRSICIPIIFLCVLTGLLFQGWNIYTNLGMTFNVEKGADEEGLSDSDINAAKEIASEYHNSYIIWTSALRGYEIIIVLLACIPYASSYVIDKKTGFMNNILLRTSSKKYILSKSIINALVGGIVVTLPSTIILFGSMLFFSNGIPTLDIYTPFGPFSEYFLSKPLYYTLFFTMILFLIGLTYSTFSMAVGMITEKIIPCLLIPLIYWFTGSLLCESLGLSSLAPWNIYYFNVEPTISLWNALIHILILFIVSISIICFKMTKEKI